MNARDQDLNRTGDLAGSLPPALEARLSLPRRRRSGPEGEIVTYRLDSPYACTDEIRVALPVTFTPYASTRPCSARCVFCSENLRKQDAGVHSSRLRPSDSYFSELSHALAALRGLPMGISLSGLEMTDDPAWFQRLLEVLQYHERDRQPFTEKVLYTNGAGLGSGSQRAPLLASISRFGVERIEWSRHSHRQAQNDRIMRFRPEARVAENSCFERSVRAVQETTPVTLVCLLQRDGICSASDLLEYLQWAENLGVGRVVFREFSQLDESYVLNGTARVLARNRVSAETVARELLSDAQYRECLMPLESSEGYYFWNIRFLWRERLEVVLEASSYRRMNALHASDVIYKLVFHANGRLTGDWSPNERILLGA